MTIPPPLRPALFAMLAGTVAAGLIALAATLLATGGWSVWKLAVLTCLAAIVPWNGVCAAHAAIGFLLLGLRAARTVPPPSHENLPMTAIALTVRNEDMDAVLPAMRRLLDGLDAAGAGDRFALFVLSDTTGGTETAVEEQAVAALRAADRDAGHDPVRIHYRRRADNAGFKSGNIMDFCDHHAAGCELMLTLDADSEMSAGAVLLLATIMQQNPHLGIAQHLIVGRPAAAAFPRLFQFGMRAGMRVWAAAQAWWQGDSGPYWGHNAMIRIAPFREHCRLEPLPDGTEILSHDQVEAARMRAAGWGVRLVPVEDGSQEANPPALPEFLRRDARWMAGNLQYRHLLFLPGLTPMGRWQLIQAILLFAGSPLYAALLLLATGAAAFDPTMRPGAGPTTWLILAWFGTLYAPKLAGYAAVLLSARNRAAHGGAARFAAGATFEIAFMLLIDAVRIAGNTLALLRHALGSREGWRPQNRADRGVGWAEAARVLWPHTLLGVACFAALALAAPSALPWVLPLAGGLPLAIPLAVLSSAPALGAWLRYQGIAAVPEEVTALQPLADPYPARA